MNHGTAIKKLISFLIFLSLMFQLSSCYRTKYRFIHETDEITSIEIVENRYTYEDGIKKDYQNVLVSVQDVDLFLEKFYSIPYKMPLYNGLVTSFHNSEIGIKFKFTNGDYEIVSSGVYKLVYESANGYDHAVDGIIGFFDEEQFDALMMEYLCEFEAPKLFLMNDRGDISSLEIVDAYMQELPDENLKLTYDTAAVVEDAEEFLDELYTLKYSYVLQEWRKGDVLERNEHRKVIKITYSNGDYEIFDSNWRDIYVSQTDQYFNDAYIGEFEREQFDALIKKYCK